MSIPTSREKGTAGVIIDYERCTSCGACVEVCTGYPLYLDKGKVEVDQSRGFGCIACGACAAVCPTDAIRISGRDLFPEDVFRIPAQKSKADYESYLSLLQSRRSTRVFKEQSVPDEVIQKILDAAVTAPMGIPPSDVGVLVFRSHRVVREVRDLLLSEMKKWRWMLSPLVVKLMQPFIGKENADMFKGFISTALNEYVTKDEVGVDWFFYDAPLALYFYGTPYCDPADALIPATYAMLAGESLGLGTCMLGFPGMIFQYSAKAKIRYNLPKKIQPGLVVIFGYAKYKNRNAIKRRFREVRFFD